MVAEGRRRGGVRGRTTLAAVIVVGIAFLLGALTMLAFVERSLTAQAADGAEVRAAELIAPPGSPTGVIDVLDPTEEFVQVLRDGEIVAASGNVGGLPPLASPSPGEHVRLDEVPFTNAPFVVASAANGDLTAVVGRNIDDEVDARNTVRKALLFGGPLLLVVVGAVTWWIVGRALRPVEDIRGEVERISARELDRRVPDVPGDDEVARLAATMNRMLDRLQRSQDRQRRLVSDASHELRSPVAAIRQHAEVAGRHPDTTHVDELAAAVLDETDRLQALVEDLLVLARLDEGDGTVAAEVDLDDIMVAEAARLRRMTTIDVDASGVGAGRVRGGAAALERVVRNLTENSARYAHARIALGLVQADGRVILTVEDDGPGIAPEDHRRVLERFVRLDDSRGRGTGGAGLGLAIVREVVVSHGGEVTLGESSLGGLRVEILLPGA
jgi:signal transduction histidine kinase